LATKTLEKGFHKKIPLNPEAVIVMIWCKIPDLEERLALLEEIKTLGIPFVMSYEREKIDIERLDIAFFSKGETACTDGFCFDHYHRVFETGNEIPKEQFLTAVKLLSL
jgi:hypothetical protein